jgi:hypothetical protein
VLQRHLWAGKKVWGGEREGGDGRTIGKKIGDGEVVWESEEWRDMRVEGGSFLNGWKSERRGRGGKDVKGVIAVGRVMGWEVLRNESFGQVGSLRALSSVVAFMGQVYLNCSRVSMPNGFCLSRAPKSKGKREFLGELGL